MNRSNHLTRASNILKLSKKSVLQTYYQEFVEQKKEELLLKKQNYHSQQANFAP